MNSQMSTNTPPTLTSMTEEQVVECMKKSKSEREWKIREEHIKPKFGNSFNEMWVRVILLSGVADEMFRKFENLEDVDLADPWEGVKISEGSGRIAPL